MITPRWLILCGATLAWSAPVPVNLTGVKPGPITVTREDATVTVHWKDELQSNWEAAFNLEPARPLIAAIRQNGKAVIENAVPLYNCATGKTPRWL